MVDKIVQQALHTIRKHDMIQQEDHVIVALSGGADSLCLLDVLLHLRDELHFRVTAMHVDHALRPESAAQAHEVVTICQQRGVHCEMRRVAVEQRMAQTGESVQEAARALRYETLDRMAQEWGAHRIAVGHTADDQAETVLMHLLRGSGGAGIAGIPPVRGNIIRPLFEVWRNETQVYCKRQGLQIIDDPSNHHDEYLRNRIRNQLIPSLEREYNQRVRQALCRMADIMRADEDFFDKVAETSFNSRELAGEVADGMARVRAAGLEQLPLALARRVLRYAYRSATGQIAPSFERLEAALALRRTGTRGGTTIQLGGRAQAVRSGPWLEIHAADS